MIAYLIKVILCSALLLVTYKLLLEREKMHRFNRFYLLFSLLFSFIVPFISFKTPAAVFLPEESTFFKTVIPAAATAVQHNTAIVEANHPFPVLPVIYATVTVLLLFRFFVNLRSIVKAINGGSKIAYRNATLVLVDDNIIPHSFLQYIFLGREDYRDMESEILLHELTHVRQRHSLDVLFIGLVQAFSWFNPFLILYRKAIRLNHEFLADASVINTCNNTAGYQYTLIARAGKQSSPGLASRFNYQITKKRLIMMTKTTSKKVALFKQATTAVSLVVVIFLFSSKSNAQVQKGAGQQPQSKVSYGQGVSPALLNEYDSTLRNMTSVKKLRNGKKAEVLDMSKCNIDRMAYIYEHMNKEQRDARIKTGTVFMTIVTPPAKKSPTTVQLQSWTDPAEYGVWLDGKRVDNSILNKYKPADFSLYWESKLAKNAANYGKHYYQVDLYTPAYYEAVYVKRTK